MSPATRTRLADKRRRPPHPAPASGEPIHGRSWPGDLLDLAWTHRYLFLSLALLAIAAAQAVQGHYSLKSDFWEHSAVVRELATHPIHPRHPQVLSDQPDPFFTPYHLLVGLLSRWSGWNPVVALSVAGIANLALLLYALRVFVTVLLGRSSPAFWTLVFALLVWGVLPPSASGFLNLISLPSVAPYPSTLAYAIALLALAATLRYVRDGRAGWLPALPLAQALVVLIHPLTALGLYVGTLVICVSHLDRARWRRCVLVGIVSALSVSMVIAWPYFSFLDAAGESAAWDANNRGAYVGVLRGTFLTLLGLPVLLWRLRRDRRDVLALTFLLLAVCFAYGGIAHRWSYGRVLALMALMVQIAVADSFDRLVARRSLHLAARVAVAAVLLVGLVGQLPGVVSAVPAPLLPNAIRQRNCCVSTAARFGFLNRRVGQYDVVMAEEWPSWVTPTFGGKAVAVRTPLAFVDDHETRRREVARFFDPMTPTDVRRTILRRYQVRFLLVEQGGLRAEFGSERSLQAFGAIIYSDPRFLLLKVA
jgi:hypothetical protein